LGFFALGFFVRFEEYPKNAASISTHCRRTSAEQHLLLFDFEHLLQFSSSLGALPEQTQVLSYTSDPEYKSRAVRRTWTKVMFGAIAADAAEEGRFHSRTHARTQGCVTSRLRVQFVVKHNL
jgi:hypothetical protein